MKIIIGFLLTLAFGLTVFGQDKTSENHGHSKTDEHLINTPNSIKWEKNFAVISGNPNKEGAPFVIRLKFADGTKIPPHWHPIDENITVISGTFLMGMGEKFDETKTQVMPAGSFALMPKEMRHFAWVKDETVIQIHGIGPFKTFWVDVPKKQNK